MKKEDLKAGYVLVFGDGRKEVLAPILYLGNETLVMFEHITDSRCQQIASYDPFEVGVIEVWGMSDEASDSMTTSLSTRKLLWEKEKPIKVTGDERVILANLPSEIKYIARDEDGRLFVYQGEPHLDGDIFYNGYGVKNLGGLTRLTFDCIKPLTCHKISDLL